MVDLTEIKIKISNFMREDAYRPLNYEELKQSMEIDETEVKQFHDALEQLEQHGDIIQTKKKKFGYHRENEPCTRKNPRK